MFTAETQVRVRYADCDPLDVVYHGSYACYFESGRAEAFRQLGCPYSTWEDKGMALVVVDMHVRYIKAARYDQLLTVKTIIPQMPSRKLTVLHEISDEKGILLTTATLQLLFVRKISLGKCSAPDYLKHALDPFFSESMG